MTISYQLRDTGWGNSDPVFMVFNLFWHSNQHGKFLLEKWAHSHTAAANSGVEHKRLFPVFFIFFFD
jgi:hypothetical protein